MVDSIIHHRMVTDMRAVCFYAKDKFSVIYEKIMMIYNTTYDKACVRYEVHTVCNRKKKYLITNICSILFCFLLIRVYITNC